MVALASSQDDRIDTAEKLVMTFGLEGINVWGDGAQHRPWSEFDAMAPFPCARADLQPMPEA